MAKKRKVTQGHKEWIYGDKVRDDEKRIPQIQKAVSEAIKGFGPKSYHRFDPAARFARKMRAKAARLRENFNLNLIDAMCWGVGSGHRWCMVRRYEAAAAAAERFCRSRR